MNTLNEEIANRIWRKIKPKIINQLEAGRIIHGNKYFQIRRQMERLGCDSDFAKEFITKQLEDMAIQIAEQRGEKDAG